MQIRTPSLDRQPSISYLNFLFWFLYLNLSSFNIRTYDALRIINLDAPSTAIEGDSIELSCLYSLNENENVNVNENVEKGIISQNSKQIIKGQDGFKFSGSKKWPEFETLYAVKWYRDGDEFFSYLTKDLPNMRAFSRDGIQVDVKGSDNQTVRLLNVSVKTSGTFRCEVSTDAPNFVTMFKERKVHVYYLPSINPVIEIISEVSSNSRASKAIDLFLGEKLELQCSTSESKPAAKLDWIVDNLLNLTTKRDHLISSYFSLESKRFVRIGLRETSRLDNRPMISSSSSNQVSRNSKANSIHMSPIINDTAIYEVINGSLIIPSNSNIKSNPEQFSLIKSANLDQFVEISTTKLTFELDSKLMKAIKDLRQRDPRTNGYQMTTTTTTTTTTNQRLTRIGQLDLSSFPKSNSTSFAKLTSWQKNPHASQATGITTNNKQDNKLTLQISCVSRILYLNMTTTIRVNLIGKARSVTQIVPKNSKQIQKNFAFDSSKPSGFHLIGLPIILAANEAFLITLKWIWFNF